MDRVSLVVFDNQPRNCLDVQLPRESGEAAVLTMRLALEALMPGVEVTSGMSGGAYWLRLTRGRYPSSGEWRNLSTSKLNSQLDRACFLGDVFEDPDVPNRVVVVRTYPADKDHLDRLGAYLEKIPGVERAAPEKNRANRRRRMFLDVPNLNLPDLEVEIRKYMRFPIGP